MVLGMGIDRVELPSHPCKGCIVPLDHMPMAALPGIKPEVPVRQTGMFSLHHRTKGVSWELNPVL